MRIFRVRVCACRPFSTHGLILFPEVFLREETICLILHPCHIIERTVTNLTHQLVGECPKSITFAARYTSESFHRKYLARFTPLSVDISFSRAPTHFCDWLLDKYLLPCDHADLIASLLKRILPQHPERWAEASKIVHNAWLYSIMV
jgi:hypothetical protein